MRRITRWALWLLPVCASALLGYGSGWRAGEAPGAEEEMACRASLDITAPALQFSGSMKFYAAKGHGVLLINGHYQQPDQLDNQLSRKVIFTYTRYGNMFYTVSRRVDVLFPDNAQESELVTFLPRFFFRSGEAFSMGLFPQGEGYIFTGTTLPLAYCLKGIS